MSVQQKPLQQIDADKLITAYKESIQKSSRARRTVAILHIATYLIFLFAIYQSFRTFTEYRLPELWQTVGIELSSDSDQYARQLLFAAHKVSPAYWTSFKRQFTKDWPKYEGDVKQELETLTKYVGKRWPRFESALKEMALAQHKIIQKELGISLGPERAHKIAMAYRKAVKERFRALLATWIKQHIEVGSQLESNFRILLSTEPDIPRPIAQREALGLFLELIGLELQAMEQK